MRQLIAALKIFCFLGIAFIFSIPQLVILIFHKGQYAYTLPQLVHRIICFLFGIKVKIQGDISKEHQTIFLSNHISYLDIPVIGSCLKASFIAKEDVKSWPLIGILAQLQQTGFISRDKKDAVKERDSMSKMIERGKNLIIFPEGTSTEGILVHTFKSSIFSSFLRQKNQNLLIQPFVIFIEEVNGKPPRKQEERDLYAWHINMDTEMPVHLWNFAKTTGASVKLIFCTPIRVKDFTDRKMLAKLCHDTVSKELEKQIQSEGI
ncbi:MAG: 1-acyl-sn-glycerol-3-phosphate acyltransferase [Alphaproteobacteria bacterium]|nr:1-acyl-sn-glycerol-3-phosphate acyltransferase [Alphaproteobacteria bacterium]